MQRFKYFFFLLCLSFSAFSQSITFEKSYPYYAGFNDVAKQCIQTADGGYAVRTQTGYVSSFVPINHGINKLDANGNLSWTFHLSLSTMYTCDYFFETNDKGYILTGTLPTDTGVGNSDVWIYKLDSMGQAQWSKIYSSQGWVDAITEGIQLTNGNYLLTTNGYSETNIIVSDSTGSLVIWKNYLQINSISNFKIINDTLISCFGLKYVPNLNFLLGSKITLNQNGDTLNSTLLIYDKDSIGIGYCKYTVRDSSKSFISLGWKLFSSGNTFSILIKFDSQGNQQWIKQLHLFPFLVVSKVSECNDGGFILTGSATINSFGNYLWMYRFDANGDSVLFKFLNGKFGAFNDAVQANDSGFLFVGSIDAGANSVPYAIKSDKFGMVYNLLSQKEIMNNKDQLFIYPNPANENTTVNFTGIIDNTLLEITNLQGQVIYVQKIQNAIDGILINTTQFYPGMYFCIIHSEKKLLACKKLLIVK